MCEGSHKRAAGRHFRQWACVVVLDHLQSPMCLKRHQTHNQRTLAIGMRGGPQREAEQQHSTTQPQRSLRAKQQPYPAAHAQGAWGVCPPEQMCVRVWVRVSKRACEHAGVRGRVHVCMGVCA